MKAILAHGRFDHKSDPDSVMEQMAHELRAAGFDAITIECDEGIPGEFVADWKVDELAVMVGFSNGGEQIVNIAKSLEQNTVLKISQMVLFDPVFKDIGDQLTHRQLEIPRNVEQCVVYLRGHQHEYPNGRTQITKQLTIVPMLTSSITDHPRVPELAMSEAIALLRGGTVPIDAPVPEERRGVA